VSSVVFRPQRRRRRAQLNLTSLIDVLFLLLIFFMLTSTFRLRGEMDLSLPQSSTAEARATDRPDQRTEITLREDGTVFLNGRAIDPALLRDELLATTADPANARVTLSAEALAKHADVVRLLDVVREAGFGGVSLGAEVSRFGEGDRK